MELVNHLNSFNTVFFNLDPITLSRWSTNRTSPSNYKQLLTSLFFKDEIHESILNNTSLSDSPIETDKILDIYFKYRKNAGYDKPFIRNENIEYSIMQHNKNKRRNVFSYFYKNFNFYLDAYDFVDKNNLKITSHFFQEYDHKHDRITSHIQASFLNYDNSVYLNDFLSKKINKKLNSCLDREAIWIDISFFRSKKTFEQLLYMFVNKIFELNYTDNPMYVICTGSYFINILDSLGGVDIGSIKDSYNNIFVYEFNSLKFLSNKYIINLYRKYYERYQIGINVELKQYIK
ncbi:hypothetical protein [Aliivibrio fischeri]|uniref:hypothetical protein n=1 Tax=Aliivibrio fischeri TaxID=668 RepID=UPI0035556C06